MLFTAALNKVIIELDKDPASSAACTEKKLVYRGLAVTDLFMGAGLMEKNKKLMIPLRYLK